MKITVYNQAAEQVKEIELNPKVFDIKLNSDLLHQVVDAQLKNKRLILAHAKDRSEVRGGGRKPWRQKGTGRARHGSNRSPIWVGGGVTFGPTKDRNFSVRINKKMKRKALFMVLSDRAKNEQIKIVDDLQLAKPKTQEMVKLLAKFKLTDKVLIINDKMDQQVVRAANNLPKAKVILADSLNVVDLLNYQVYFCTEKSLDVIEKTFLK